MDSRVIICSDGSFTIKHSSNVITSKNGNVSGGAKKSRYYIYNKHRYTKTCMHDKKKCIFSKKENKYVPVKELKGGFLENGNNAGACTSMPLSDDILRLMNDGFFEDKQTQLKDILPFYIVTAKSLHGISSGSSILLSFITSFIQKILNTHGEIDIELSSINGGEVFHFEEYNIKETAQSMINFLSSDPDLVHVSYYASDNVVNSQRLASFVSFLDFQKIKKTVEKFETQLQGMKQNAKTLKNNAKMCSRKMKMEIWNEQVDKIQPSKIFLILKDASDKLKTIKTYIDSENRSNTNLTDVECALDGAKHILDELRKRMDTLKVKINSKNSNAKINAYSNVYSLIEYPDDMFEPDLDDNYLFASMGYGD